MPRRTHTTRRPRRFFRKFQVQILWDFPDHWTCCAHLGCGCNGPRLWDRKVDAEKAMEAHIQRVLGSANGSIKEASLRSQVRVKPIILPNFNNPEVLRKAAA